MVVEVVVGSSAEKKLKRDNYYKDHRLEIGPCLKYGGSRAGRYGRIQLSDEDLPKHVFAVLAVDLPCTPEHSRALHAEILVVFNCTCPAPSLDCRDFPAPPLHPSVAILG